MAAIKYKILDKTCDVGKLAKQFNQRSFAAPIDWGRETNGFDLAIVSDLLVEINADIRESVIKLFCGLYQQYCMEHTGITIQNDEYVNYSCNLNWERDLRNLLAQKIKNVEMFSAFCQVNNKKTPDKDYKNNYSLKTRIELSRKLLNLKSILKFLKLDNTSKAKLLSVILGNSDEKIRGLLSTPEDNLIPERSKKEVEEINAMLKKDGFNVELKCKSKK